MSRSVVPTAVLAVLVLLLGSSAGPVSDDLPSTASPGALGDPGDVGPQGDAPLDISGTYTLEQKAIQEGWQGNGTAGNPYVIEGYDIDCDGGGFGINLRDIPLHILVRNNRIVDTAPAGSGYQSHAIRVQNVRNITIESNTFEDHGDAGLRGGWSDLTVRDNVFINVSTAIIVTDCRSIIEGNQIEGRSGVQCKRGSCDVLNNSLNGSGRRGNGVDLDEPDSFNVVGNSIRDYVEGVRALEQADLSLRSRIADNTIWSVDTGMDIGLSNLTVDGNTIDADEEGIYLYTGVANFRNNSLTGTGINFDHHNDERWDIDESNTVNGYPFGYFQNVSDHKIADDYGQIYMGACHNISIDNRTIPAVFYSLTLIDTTDIDITSNRWDNSNPMKIWLIGVARTTIINNWVFQQTRIDFALTCVDNRIIGNGFNGSSISFGHSMSSGNVIANNTFMNSKRYTINANSLDYADLVITGNEIQVGEGLGTALAINLGGVNGAKVSNNTITGGYIRVTSNRQYHWESLDFDDTNTVDGKPVIFRCNRTGIEMDGDFGQVIMGYCDNFTVSGMNLSRGYAPIYLYRCEDGTVKENQFYDMEEGAIAVTDCTRINMTRNVVSGGESNVAFTRCKTSKFEHNLITDISPPTFDKWAVNLFLCEDVTIRWNTIANVDGYGLYFERGGLGYIVRYNQIENTSSHAIVIQSANQDHIVQYNNFDGNNWTTSPGVVEGPQCSDYGIGTIWDDGTKGNYWSDYLDRYPAATMNGDVWSEPYQMHGLPTGGPHHDNFPLIKMVDLIPPIIIAPDDYVIDQGQTLDVAPVVIDNVGVTNYTWGMWYDGRPITQYSKVFSFTFDIPGTYNVTLRVRDAWGNREWATFRVFVRDTEPPQAAAGDDQYIDQGKWAFIDASGSTDNVGIVNYTWSFTYEGSLVTLYGTYQLFRFDIPGEYNITLAVRDAQGNLGYDHLIMFVSDTESPVAVQLPDLTIDQGESVNLTAEGSGDNVGIVDFRWTVSTGSGTRKVNGYHFNQTFQDAGLFKVTLRVLDRAGNSDETQFNVTVRDTEPPVPDPGGDRDVLLGTLTTLDGRASQDNVGIEEYRWKVHLPDGDVVLDGPVVEFTFDSVGWFNVTLEVADAGSNRNSSVFRVFVYERSSPLADAGEDIEVDQGTVVTFDGSSSDDDTGIVSWRWEFEYDGARTVLEGETTDFKFEIPGTYAVVLRVADLSGNTAADALNVNVRDTLPPVASAGPDIAVDQGGLVLLDGSASSDNVEVVSWRWTFFYDGQQMAFEEDIVEHLFDLAGQYDVRLTVEDAAGNNASDSLTVEVRDIEPPVADAGPDMRVETGKTTRFDGSRSADNVGVVNWTWTFRDGEDIVMYGPTPTHEFEGPGRYRITLSVTDGMGLAAQDELEVTVEGPDGWFGIWVLVAISVAILAAVSTAIVLIRKRK